jgi:hypothetical protein
MPLPTPVALDDTVGGADANTYASLAYANDYFVTRLWAATDWEQARDDFKNRALVMATRLLDQWFDWIGVVVSADQALLWPRTGAVGANGYLIATDVIPREVSEACCEWARELIKSDRTADSGAQGSNISKIVAGPIEIDYSGTATAKPIPDNVLSLLSRLGTVRSKYGSGNVELLRA